MTGKISGNSIFGGGTGSGYSYRDHLRFATFLSFDRATEYTAISDQEHGRVCACCGLTSADRGAGMGGMSFFYLTAAGNTVCCYCLTSLKRAATLSAAQIKKIYTESLALVQRDAERYPAWSAPLLEMAAKARF